MAQRASGSQNLGPSNSNSTNASDTRQRSRSPGKSINNDNFNVSTNRSPWAAIAGGNRQSISTASTTLGREPTVDSKSHASQSSPKSEENHQSSSSPSATANSPSTAKSSHRKYNRDFLISLSTTPECRALPTIEETLYNSISTIWSVEPTPYIERKATARPAPVTARPTVDKRTDRVEATTDKSRWSIREIGNNNANADTNRFDRGTNRRKDEKDINRNDKTPGRSNYSGADRNGWRDSDRSTYDHRFERDSRDSYSNNRYHNQYNRNEHGEEPLPEWATEDASPAKDDDGDLEAFDVDIASDHTFVCDFSSLAPSWANKVSREHEVFLEKTRAERAERAEIHERALEAANRAAETAHSSDFDSIPQAEYSTPPAAAQTDSSREFAAMKTKWNQTQNVTVDNNVYNGFSELNIRSSDRPVQYPSPPSARHHPSGSYDKNLPPHLQHPQPSRQPQPVPQSFNAQGLFAMFQNSNAPNLPPMPSSAAAVHFSDLHSPPGLEGHPSRNIPSYLPRDGYSSMPPPSSAYPYPTPTDPSRSSADGNEPDQEDQLSRLVSRTRARKPISQYSEPPQYANPLPPPNFMPPNMYHPSIPPLPAHGYPPRMSPYPMPPHHPPGNYGPPYDMGQPYPDHLSQQNSMGIPGHPNLPNPPMQPYANYGYAPTNAHSYNAG